jgi:hypothetical protein
MLHDGARITLLGAVVVAGVGTLLPFATSGERSRSSYELVSLARRLEIVPAGWPSAAARLWFAVPLVLVVCWLLVVVGRTPAAAWCALAAAAVLTFGLIAVWRSPLDVATGWAVTLGGTVGLVTSAAVLLTTARRVVNQAEARADTE